MYHCILLTIFFVFYLYILLIEFEVRTVKYGPSFFPSIYGPNVLILRLIRTASFCGKLDTVQDYFEITPEVM